MATAQTENIIQYGWQPRQRGSAPHQALSNRESTWRCHLLRASTWNMHAPCRSGSHSVCSVFLFFLGGCDSNSDEIKHTTNHAFISQSPCCDTDTARPDNNTTDLDCCAFHVGGRVTVWERLTINRTKQELDQLIMSSGYPTGSLN